MTAPTTKDFLVASNAAYTEASTSQATNTTPSQSVLQSNLQATLVNMGEPSWHVVDVQTAPTDGFYGAAFLNNSGDLIISFEGTVPGTSDYAKASLAANSQILQHQTPTALVVHDQQFAANAAQAALSTPGFDGNVYVTGHSLGGVQAEYATQWLAGAGHVAGTTFDGGATFGAMGIPGHSSQAAPFPSLTNYVDYGDPVGSYATDMPASAHSDYPPGIMTPQDHVGTVMMVGDPSNWNTSTPQFQMLQFHYLPQYQSDLGVTISGSPAVENPALADQVLEAAFVIF